MRKPRILAEAADVARPVLISLIAMGVAGCALMVQDWGASSWLLGGVLAVLGVGLVLQVRWSVRRLGRECTAARRSARQAERHYVAVLRKIVRHVESRETYWDGHSANVGALARRMAERMHLPPERCELLGLAGELHDLGMLAVPEAVRLKRKGFAAADFRVIQKHSQASYDLLEPLSMLRPVLAAVRYHHERMNGTGYPEGLSGPSIPRGARIIAAADAYDAMTHDRPHRPALSPPAAIRELRRCAPSGYDPSCVEALAQVVNLATIDGGTQPQDAAADAGARPALAPRS
ncbi:MAG: HD domain-containing phosphohydrolase [Planctomycetota bacterium]